MRIFLTTLLFFIAFAALSQSAQVDTYTGRLSCTIPLGSISSGPLSVPIGLSYQTKGMKVMDREGNAGMGWNVIIGGRITREVRGLPDDVNETNAPTRTGWLIGTNGTVANNFTAAGDTNYSVCADEGSDYTALNAFGYNKDTEPDYFTFEAPGLSGGFVFDKNHNAVPIPYQDIKIEITRPDKITQIAVTTNEGVKYVFQAGISTTRKVTRKTTSTIVDRFQTLLNQYSTELTFNESWNLAMITSPLGGSIAYHYASAATTSSNSEAYREVTSAGVLTTLYTISDTKVEKVLDYLEGDNETATVAWGGGVYASITFKEKSFNKTKKYNFTYNYVRGGFVSGYSSKTRPFLTGLSQEANCQTYPAYAFEYHGIDLINNTTEIPLGTDARQDHFGYYNSTGTSLAPDLYIKSGDTGTNGERYRFESATGYNLISTGGNRGVHPDKAFYGSLSKLTLPAGGTYEATYEPNTYYDATAAFTNKGAGVRVKTLKTRANNPASDITETYNYDYNSQSTGRWTYRPMFATGDGANTILFPKNIAPDETIVYSKVDVTITGAGKSTYEFLVPGVYPETSNGDFAATYTRLARTGGNCSVGDPKMTGYYTYPFAVTTNYDFERGLPNAITDYDGGGRIVRKRTYSYQRTTAPVNSISGVRYEPAAGGYFVYSKYSLLGNVTKRTLTETTWLYDKSDVTNAKYLEAINTYTYNSNQMLRQVSNTNSDNAMLTQTFKYAKDYAATGTDKQSTMINNLVAANRHGTLIETTNKNGSAYTDATITIFDNTFGGSRVLPRRVLKLSDPSGFNESTISGTSFIYSNTKYSPSIYVDAYDDVGNPTIARDNQRTATSVIFGHNSTVPALEVTNAKTDELLFADFEPHTSQYPTTPGSINYTEGYTGRQSLNLNVGYSIGKSLARGQGRYYRLYCWVKAAGASTLNIQINGSTLTSVNYTNAGSWQLIDKRVDLNLITSTFTFGLSATSSITIDNVVFYPEVASFVMHGYEPLYGKTSDLDNRGGGSFQEYDAMGRLYRVRNQDKDIVKIVDYRYAREVSPPTLQIVGYVDPLTGIAATYSVDLGCLTGGSYQWFVDGASAGTGATLSYTFNQNRNYQLKVSVGTNFGTIVTEITVHPIPHVEVDFFVPPADRSIDCFDSNRTLTVTLGGCYDTANITFDWYIQVEDGFPAHTLISGMAGASYNVNLPDPGPAGHLTVWCVVTTRCPNLDTGTEQAVAFSSETAGFFRRPNVPGCDN